MTDLLGGPVVVYSAVATINIGGSPLALAGQGLQALIGLLFVVSGGVKLFGADEMVQNFERWGYPQWFRLVTGLVETTGGVALLVGLIVSAATTVGGIVLAVTMLGAIYTHTVRVDDPISETAKPTTLLVLLVIVLLLL